MFTIFQIRKGRGYILKWGDYHWKLKENNHNNEGQREGGRGVKKGVGGEGGRRRERRISFTESYIAQNC